MRKMTKSLMAGAVAALASAAAIPGIADAAPCVTTTLNNWLVAGFSCTVGDKTFSNFTYSPDGFTLVPATSVGVGPDTGAAAPGLVFNALWTDTGATNLDALLGFTVAAPANATITGADLLLDGVVGPVLDVESLVANGGTLSSSDNLLHTANFAGITSTSVMDDVGVRPTGAISSIHKDFVESTVFPNPEPASLAILGSALAGLGLLRRHRRKAA